MAPLLTLSVPSLSRACVLLPLSAFLFCLSHAVLLDAAAATATHCRVPNWAPSVSAAVGGHTSPARAVAWRVALALHAAPRGLVALLYLARRRANALYRVSKFFGVASNAAFACNVAEILGLLLLSVVPSKEHYAVHKLGFISFIFFSTVYILLSVRLESLSRPDKRSKLETKSFSFKKRICALYLLFLALALYFFYRHNARCEPGVYSLFSLCEYAIVLLNMAFHYTAAYDFHDKVLTI